MATETPITDVLCEAMEYLCKLGTNLRSRSESLKEKRISKSKLKNSHAVQKAANKVLMICQLSKKSLENVETGVRKVLSLVDATQNATMDGGKTTKPKEKNRDDSKYHYFKLNSKELRVAKTVALKHFLSVKVCSKKMSLKIQEEYPVFYDCKLLRLRKRKAAIQKTRRSKSSEKTARKLSSNESSNEKLFKMDCENKEAVSLNEGESSHSAQCNDTSQPLSNIRKGETCIQNSDTDTKNHNSIVQPTIDITLPTEIKIYSAGSGTKVVGIEEPESKSENITEISNSVVRKKAEKSIYSRHRKRIKIMDEESNSSSASSKKDNAIECLKEVNKNQNATSDIESNDKEKIHRKKKQNLVDSDQEKEKKEYEQIISLDSENEKIDGDTCSENSDQKPMIKCVNINELLKPEALQKDPSVKEKSKKVVQGKPTGPHKRKENNTVELKKTNITNVTEENGKFDAKQITNDDEVEKCVSVQTSDREFWEQKRKEVKRFKSKHFEIHLTRLPKFTTHFLHDHKIKRIVQNNSVVFGESHELSKECNVIVDSIPVDNDASHSKSRLEEVKCSGDTDVDENTVNKVKNALLNESESDEDKIIYSKTDKKKASNEAKIDDIRRGSTSGLTSRNSDIDCEDSENFINPLVYETDSDKIETISKENYTNQIEVRSAEELKEALLKDSDSEQTKINDVCMIQRTEYMEASTSVKSIELTAESENVKNKLLNSDSEDDTKAGSEKNDNHSEANVKRNIDRNNGQSDASQHDNGSTEECNASTCIESTKSNEGCSHIKDKITTQSADADVHSTLLSKRSKHKRETIKSKRKHIMESMHAKKMLLSYSSSDTEDEQLKNVLKEIKQALLKGASSDEEKVTYEQPQRCSNRTSSSSSTNDSIRNIKQRTKKINKVNSSHSESEGSKGDKEQTQDNEDDPKSKSSSRKMVRSKAKPGNRSSQNSDNQDSTDKDIDRLTNLNKLNSTHQRHGSSSPEHTRTSRRKSKPAVALLGEDLLKAESSDAASMADSDGDIEELPAVPLPSLNGSGIVHLAKDDLLEESDSSASHEKEKSSEEYQNTEETDEENVKARRRKALAISSDSEVGSSRRKEARVSDFEDSEDDGSDAVKKIKRKKREPNSDASASSSDDGSKKKRRRIKIVNESDLSGSDTETEGRNKHGRKNIRKVMGKNQLEEATKKAARQEKERIARIAERQKLYNNLEFDESGKPDEVVLDKVVLDFDPETKEPLIEVDRGLVKKLKPHQANGIKFMWDACFESVKRIKKDRGSGCILAHCMGLGKTLQVVSLTHTLLTHGSLTGVNRVLVVCPLSTVLNWVNEFNMWLKHAETEYDVDVYELSRFKQNSERAFQLQQWFTHGGVCVLGYEMFRNLSADNSKKYKKKMLRHFQESLVDPGPDLVVCDEGHLLKNEKTSLSQSMNRVKTHRRIVLTGTPLQNNLKEYYCMVQFVKPNLLGKYNEYLNRFVNPITNGQYTDSTEHDIRIMKRRSHVLHKMLDGAVQRRDYGVLAPFLPPKHEYVLFITLSEVQIKLYQFYLVNYSRRPLPGKSSGFLFPDFQSLQRVWTHPLVLKYNSERYEIMQQKKREREEEEDSEGSMVDFINDDSTPDETTTEESSDSDSDISDDSRKKSKKKKSAKKKVKDAKGPRRGTRANPVELEEDDNNVAEIVEVKTENPTEWWIPLVTDDILEDMRNSHKLVLLFDILKHCEAIGDKLLVFSQSLYSLDLIEHFLGKVDEATQEARIDEKLGGHVGSWSPGVDYFRLDGSTSCENRSIWCKNFNREDNPRARLFLISTRAGGLGINLVAANRVVIFDVSWNPSHDVQSIFRVYRFGQKKPCYVYRFLAMGTMEEKIYERQVTKQAISKRVIDEQQIDRHYAENDLAELYKFEPQPPSPRPLPPLPKDRLFAEMLKEHEVQIYKYHEHDSLLENKEEETLSEEERKAAWEDFENEKTRPPPSAFPTPWPMHNGMVPGLVQQQQMAYATLAAMVRKDMPNITDNQIRDMLPLIYNSNPGMFGGYDYGLMQKLSDIYKYSQAGMMNPSMMNHAAMNSGAVASGGGSSGLQYEPPWQRQLQQQQQLRLQQLMQQQQSMGAKFYAGGLGSRDPVAMALQQQRAREIMVGGAGRPRGRPPLQPRAPALPALPQDVVNLDSD